MALDPLARHTEIEGRLYAVLAWPRVLIACGWDYSKRRSRAGRLPTASAGEALVLWLARENPWWGRRRNDGELVRSELAGIDPAPRRCGPVCAVSSTPRRPRARRGTTGAGCSSRSWLHQGQQPQQHVLHGPLDGERAADGE
ncbi:hypothetical protein ADK64_37650 [Streptomyces sp. MMG1121]|nr:hypothetical protein ADK64_37650 [Streptomyces sp. MMG1121]